MLDPFRPENPEDVARLNTLLNGLHANFIAQVKERRGSKLDTKADLFTGEVWLARQAAELGLIDGIAHLKPEMQTRYGDKVKFRRYGLRRPFWTRFGAALAQDALAGIEERAEFARFGL